MIGCQSGGKEDLAPAVLGSAFRSVVLSLGIHESDGRNPRVSETEGDLNSSLLG